MAFNYNEVSNVMSFDRNELFAHDISMNMGYMVHYSGGQCLPPVIWTNQLILFSVHGHVNNLNSGHGGLFSHTDGGGANI